MPNTKICEKCKGEGYLYVLVSMHDDKKELIKCPDCRGTKVIHHMTEEEEKNYWEDYW